MNNFQGDINKTRELLSQAVQCLVHVHATNRNSQPNISAANTSGTNTYHRSSATDDTPSSHTSASGRSSVNCESPYFVPERRALFRPN